MSTRSFIGFDNGIRLEGNYCHYDGYPEHVGMILVQHHNTYEAMRALVKGPQIRNLDHDGTVCRFGDGDSGVEYADSAKEILESGYDYAYLFGNGKWRCFTKDRSLPEFVKEVNIPNNTLSM